jgi:TolB-like protein/DNA-binding winged helix-turn-helix (wHTH) protein
VSEDCAIVEFGPFRLDTGRRLLTRDGQPVSVSSRAFDVLRVLVENRDRVMSKDDLIADVWRGVVVEENNLAVQVSALRRALGEAELDAPLILTVPGQGYRFVGRIAAPLPHAAPTPQAADDAPGALAELVAAPIAPARHMAARPQARRRWRLILAASAACAAILLTAASLLFSRGGTPPVPVPPRLSIAVLPFRDLSDDRCCAYLADAVSDDLTTDLSHIPGSVVIARESSDVYRDKTMPMPDIGRGLNVRYLLEGSLRPEDGNFSINAQLIEASNSTHLWADRFVVPRRRLGEAQDAIVHRIASALGVQLIQIEGTTAARERGGNPDALDLFIQARSILDRSDSVATMTAAQHLLDQALARQPEFAAALEERAFLLARRLNDVSVPEFATDRDTALRADAAALRVVPNSGLAIAARGLLLSADQRWGEARASLEAALAIEPESVPVRVALISCLSRLGLYEAELQSIGKLLQIDPEAPGTKKLLIQRGIAYFMLNQPADALTWLGRGMASGADHGGDALSHNEYGELFRIASLQLLRQDDAAHAAMIAYMRAYPNRTAWQIGNHLTRAQAARPGATRLVDALVAAGMPRFMDESTDMGVAATRSVDDHGPFDPTPVAIPAPAGRVDTADLHRMLALMPPPRLINVGSAAVTPDPSRARCGDFDWEAPGKVAACVHALTAEGTTAPVVVMGRSATDWNGYYGALALADAGVPGVLWYRGGEEAWVAAGGVYQDTRR